LPFFSGDWQAGDDGGRAIARISPSKSAGAKRNATGRVRESTKRVRHAQENGAAGMNGNRRRGMRLC